MQPSREQLTQVFLDMVERVCTNMRSETTEVWPDMELTIPQFRTMALMLQGPQRMGSIATHLNTSLSSATSMIDRLVGKDLVERTPDAHDRRVVACQLTARGKQEMDSFLQLQQLQFSSIAGRLSLEELELVVQAMEVLCRASQRPADQH